MELTVKLSVSPLAPHSALTSELTSELMDLQVRVESWPVDMLLVEKAAERRGWWSSSLTSCSITEFTLRFLNVIYSECAFGLLWKLFHFSSDVSWTLGNCEVKGRAQGHTWWGMRDEFPLTYQDYVIRKVHWCSLVHASILSPLFASSVKNRVAGKLTAATLLNLSHDWTRIMSDHQIEEEAWTDPLFTAGEFNISSNFTITFLEALLTCADYYVFRTQIKLKSFPWMHLGVFNVKHSYCFLLFLLGTAPCVK